MYRKIQLLLALLMLSSLSLLAEQLAYQKYDWERDPVLHTLEPGDTADNYLVLKDKTILDFTYEQTGELVMYETRHIIIHINNEKGIEEANKVYIPYSTVLEQVAVKARTIMSNGKVIMLSKSAVKKVDNLEDHGPYLIFAMEGVDKGGEIEYLYTMKKSYNSYNSVRVQISKIKKNVNIDIYSPSNLIYEARGYNGFPDFTIDSVIKNKNHIFAGINMIPAMEEEEYSATDASKMRYDYQLTYNTAKSNARMYTWEYSGNNIYANLYTSTKSEEKAIDKLLKNLQVDKLTSDEAKIAAVEQYMKLNILYKDLDEDIPVDKMLDVKYGNTISLYRFYILSAKQLGIPVEIVATCNRMERKFDNTFPSLNSIQENLIYYPSFKKYLFAANYVCRLGFPPPVLLGNKGLFIKETQVGDIKAPVAKIKNIETVDYTKSYNNIYASVDFDKETMTPTIKVKFELMGYSAYGVQPTLLFLDDDKKKEVGDNISKLMGVETVVKSQTIKGGEPGDILKNPFIVESVIETPQLIEQAGKKYIFKLGKMIGEQNELYKEKERQTDVEIPFTQSYTRELTVKIPAGYKVSSLDGINIDKRYTVDGTDQAAFISSYKLEGDVLKVKIYEDYRLLFYPKEKFETYRSVVNASADFNKVVVILEKI